MLTIYQLLIVLYCLVFQCGTQTTVTTTLGPLLPPIPAHPTPTSTINNSVSAHGDSTTSRSSNCKVTYTVGYGYRRVFHWADSMSEKNGTATSATLNFRVRAFNDAHIMLSTSSSPVEREPVYEIVIGAGKNSFSDIRRVRRGNTKVTVPTPDIVSPYELRGFWIRLSNQGIIEVGRENEDLAFMAWRDPQPLPVRYFGFCTWTGTVGKWEYDCPSTDPEQQEQDSNEVEKNLTWAQQLRRDLLLQYDPYSRPVNNPDQLTTVHLHLACQHINLNENTNSILVHGTMSMHWMDEKLVWDVEKYGGLKMLHAATYEIWLPELILYNAADGAGDSLFNNAAAHVTVRPDGAVMWSPQASLQTLCSLTLGAWPRDQHKCTLRIGAWSHASLVDFKLMENGTVLDDQHTSSQWSVEAVSASLVPELHPSISHYDYEGDENSTLGNVFHLEITVRRKSSAYHTLLFVPIGALAVSLVASFWVSPLQWSRFLLCLINLMIIMLFMIVIGASLPPTAGVVPQIVTLYNRGLLVATVALLVTVLVTNLTRHKFKKPPPRIITEQLNGILGLLLLLPPPSKDSNEARKTYGHLDEPKALIEEENSEDGHEISVVKSSPEDVDQNQQDQWIRLATAIDRFVFITYVIFLAIILI